MENLFEIAEDAVNFPSAKISCNDIIDGEFSGGQIPQDKIRYGANILRGYFPGKFWFRCPE